MRILSFLFGGAAAGSLALAACSVSTTPYEFTPIDAGTTDARATVKNDSSVEDDPQPVAKTDCEKVCVAAASAKCKNASSCVSDCESERAKIPSKCKPQAKELDACAAKSTSFRCNASGDAVLDDACEDEGLALVGCLTEKPDAEAPETCGPVATYFKGASCETCRKKDCCTESADCGNNPECVALVNCIAKAGCTTDACANACAAEHQGGVDALNGLYSCMDAECSDACQ